jgi:brefeldin A-resistance guanine nucleotide exchange factor 1
MLACGWLPCAGFGRAYFKVAPDIFANEDAAYILAYSVIMLNTDRHNNQVHCLGV